MGTLNKTERAYEETLKTRMLVGEILYYKFEAVKLRLADNCFYTPDFLVMNVAQEIELHEVKGFWTDDARVKVKVAAAEYPLFRFVAVRKSAGGLWATEEF